MLVGKHALNTTRHGMVFRLMQNITVIISKRMWILIKFQANQKVGCCMVFPQNQLHRIVPVTTKFKPIVFGCVWAIILITGYLSLNLKITIRQNMNCWRVFLMQDGESGLINLILFLITKPTQITTAHSAATSLE